MDEIGPLRKALPNLGENKLYPLLKAYCNTINLTYPKPATIGRIIADQGGMRTKFQRITGTGKVKPLKREKALRKHKNFVADRPGKLVVLDTVELPIHGKRRYIITCEDIASRFAFAWATTSHASKAAEGFFNMWQKVFPYKITFVLTDNGSEFKKNFAKRLTSDHPLQDLP